MRLRWAAIILAGVSVVSAIFTVFRIASQPVASADPTTTVVPFPSATTDSDSTGDATLHVELADISDPALVDWSAVDFAGVDPHALIQSFSLTTDSLEVAWFDDMMLSLIHI